MAMTMTGEATLPAGRSRVWALLNDPDVLKTCIPGCQSLERAGDNGFAAVAKVKIGPVTATFKGKVELSDIVPDVGYTISGEGEGGIAGFAKGGAKVSLADAAGGTLLRYDVEAQVGGKIAQLGSRLIDGVARNMAEKFFSSFAEEAARSGPSRPSARPTNVEAYTRAAEPLPTAPLLQPTPAQFAPAPAAQPARPVPPLGLGLPRAAPLQSAAPPKPAVAAPQVSPPQVLPTKKKSWLRRIWEWFMSR
jgi:carbon monoxide dehydrogenase subunit G